MESPKGPASKKTFNSPIGTNPPKKLVVKDRILFGYGGLLLGVAIGSGFFELWELRAKHNRFWFTLKTAEVRLDLRKKDQLAFRKWLHDSIKSFNETHEDHAPIITATDTWMTRLPSLNVAGVLGGIFVGYRGDLGLKIFGQRWLRMSLGGTLGYTLFGVVAFWPSLWYPKSARIQADIELTNYLKQRIDPYSQEAPLCINLVKDLEEIIKE